MIEQLSGEAGVLRTALGVVLARVGIDVRVRLYLWSGGVEDVVLPTMGAEPMPVGAQVVVMFLSDRPASGMVVGTIEGLLSWRRTAAPAFVDYMQPYMQEVIAKAAELDETLTVTEGTFVAEEGLGLFGGAVLMADGRVFFVPGQTGGGSEVIKPHIWDPYTGGMHLVDVPWEAGAGDEFLGGCLLQDGRVFFMPHPWSTIGQAYIYDPDRDCLLPAGPPLAAECCGCVLLPDGRVLLVPHIATSPRIYDPKADTITTSQVVTPPELQTSQDFWGGVLLGDGRVLLVPYGAAAAMVYNPLDDTAAVVEVDLQGCSCVGGVLLADGRVYLVPSGTARTAIFDPATDTFGVEAADPVAVGGWGGGALLADGTVLLLPGTYSELRDCRIYNPVTNTYGVPSALAAAAPAAQGVFGGGAVLQDGRVVFNPWFARDLVVWEPGLGVCFGRDVALSGFWNHRP